MAAEGKNKVASSLLDLQSTAILEMYKIFPDRINKPTLFIGIHGGSVFDKAIVWQGVQYLPMSIEAEGFDILADGKLARPKIRVANKNNLITNLLQNNNDLVNAKIIRKKVQVKYLDDENFDGGNPFGEADSKAELADDTWLMGRKTQESKILVEFELSSPLDLENFSVNPRGVVSKFCYWQYRGEGCRYAGLPIERDDGEVFKNQDGDPVVPTWPSSYKAEGSPVTYVADPDAVWQQNRIYEEGDIVFTESPTIKLSPPDGAVNTEGSPLRTYFVCVSGGDANKGQHPEWNPSYWQKDGCSKRLSACKKRFNTVDFVEFVQGQNTFSGFSGVKITGVSSLDNRAIPTHTGLFHSTDPAVTGHFDKNWTIVGWAHTNGATPRGGGILSTSMGDRGNWPISRFINIGRKQHPRIVASFLGWELNSSDAAGTAFREVVLKNNLQTNGEDREWTRYVITNSTGTANFINGEGDDEDTIINFHVNDGNIDLGANDPETRRLLSHNFGNFASWGERKAMTWDTHSKKATPQTFMLGAQEYSQNTQGYETNDGFYTTSMNGILGPWAVWNRNLNQEEISYLYKTIPSPYGGVENTVSFVPRPYHECTGRMSTLTGGTGDGMPAGTAPLLYGQHSLVAWWDGSTGSAAIGNGLLDIHTGGNHLTGSGTFSGVREDYYMPSSTSVANPTPPNPRYGGFPGTDGFSYGRNTRF
jgi:lambda family phage minor tail protein L